MYILDLVDCGFSWILKTIYFVRQIINVLKFLIPIGLIIMLSIDILKAVIASDENEMKKATKTASSRLIYAVVIFFVPTIVSVAMNTLVGIGVDYSYCLTSLDYDDIVMVERAEEIQEQIKEDATMVAMQRRASQEKITKKKIKLASSGVATGSGCDGMVYYEDGKYYKPSGYGSGADGTKGSADYGYNKYFFESLKAFVKAANSAGYSISYSTSEYGAWRPLSNQQYYYNCYITQSCNNGNLAAVPGTSNHGWGIASDMSFGSYAAKQWAHEHVNEYNLSFPLCYKLGVSCVEDWHIEPLYLETNDGMVSQCS